MARSTPGVQSPNSPRRGTREGVHDGVVRKPPGPPAQPGPAAQCFSLMFFMGTLVAPRAHSWLKKGGISLDGEGKKPRW